jgi:hypothetical protein
MPSEAAFYSPGRLKSLLWRYDELVQLTRGVADAETSTQHLPREQPQGGFEDGATIQADIDTALMQLEPILRRVVIDYYIRGYAAVEIAAHLKHAGVNRWFVDRARHRGIRQMAIALHWIPPPARAEDGAPLDLDDEQDVRGAELKERLGMIVARAFHRCPSHGPPGYACPVIECRGYFDSEDGTHVGEMFRNVA